MAAAMRHANSVFAARDFASAEMLYSRILQDHPAHINALNNRAIALLMQQKHAQALADCDRVLVLEPNNWKAIFRQAKSLCGLRRYSDAAALLNAAVPRIDDEAVLAISTAAAVRGSRYAGVHTGPI